MITAGVDFAAEAANTALAVLRWDTNGAHVVSLSRGVTDEDLLEAIPRADKTGVDCPLGWPEAFVDVVTAHRAAELRPPATSGRDWRRGLTMRATDLDVTRRTGLIPLSVSADRIGHAALRWAAVEAGLAHQGVDVRRDGRGPLVEVYPAAALTLWGLRSRGYKRAANRVAREQLVDALLVAAGWLDLGHHEGLCRADDDALDAVLCALIARSASVGQRGSPTPRRANGPQPGGQADAGQPDAGQPPHSGQPLPAAAVTEGWIHLPTGRLADLAD